MLTGEVGTGKTTLIYHLLNWLREQNTPTAFIFNSHLTVNHLFDFILTDFGVPIDFRLNGNMLLRLNQWLMGRSRAGKKPVLIVDEAQGLSIGALEEIRLLLNLETNAEKLLQIVLVGQPELEEKLKRPELRQLRQRIEIRCRTAPLQLEESRSYIEERLRIAGANGKPIFSAEAMDAAYSYSKGVPRVLNLLCEHALINAYAEQSAPVPAWAVEEAARDFLLEETGPSKVRHHDGDDTSGGSPARQSALKEKLVQPVTMEESALREQAQAKWPSVSTVACHDESELVATAKKNSVFVPRKGAAVDHGLRIVYLTQVLQRWFVEFVHDWNAMLNFVELPLSVKSLFQWLRQPVLSKRMHSGRKQPV